MAVGGTFLLWLLVLGRVVCLGMNIKDLLYFRCVFLVSILQCVEYFGSVGLRFCLYYKQGNILRLI